MGLLNKLKGLLGLHTVTSQAVVAAPAPVFTEIVKKAHKKHLRREARQAIQEY